MAGVQSTCRDNPYLLAVCLDFQSHLARGLDAKFSPTIYWVCGHLEPGCRGGRLLKRTQTFLSLLFSSSSWENPNKSLSQARSLKVTLETQAHRCPRTEGKWIRPCNHLKNATPLMKQPLFVSSCVIFILSRPAHKPHISFPPLTLHTHTVLCNDSQLVEIQSKAA